MCTNNSSTARGVLVEHVAVEKQSFCAIAHAEEREARVRATITRAQRQRSNDCVPPPRRPVHFQSSRPVYKSIAFPFTIADKWSDTAPSQDPEGRRTPLVIAPCARCNETDKLRVTVRTTYVYVRCHGCAHIWTEEKTA